MNFFVNITYDMYINKDYLFMNKLYLNIYNLYKLLFQFIKIIIDYKFILNYLEYSGYIIMYSIFLKYDTGN